jgi:hypothetical protein
LFRKLYWVTEEFDSNGQSHVGGVYTSIPHLVRHGLRSHGTTPIRLTLTKLDADSEALGCWESPLFSGLERDLQKFIQTDEFSADQCQMLLETVRAAYSASLAS